MNHKILLALALAMLPLAGCALQAKLDKPRWDQYYQDENSARLALDKAAAICGVPRQQGQQQQINEIICHAAQMNADSKRALADRSYEWAKAGYSVSPGAFASSPYVLCRSSTVLGTTTTYCN